MRYWLFKSEPNTWSWDQQVAKGEAGEEWDGVRNYQARNNMREMKLGDRGFFLSFAEGEGRGRHRRGLSRGPSRQHHRRCPVGMRGYQSHPAICEAP